MGHINKVLTSIEDDTGARCVDIFIRPDGSHGYREYRRDPEDGRGWAAIGDEPAGSFATKEEAIDAALKSVAWL
jgi:hypothetical protein